MHLAAHPFYLVFSNCLLLYDYLATVYNVDTLLHCRNATAMDVIDYSLNIYVDIVDTCSIINECLTRSYELSDESIDFLY